MVNDNKPQSVKVNEVTGDLNHNEKVNETVAQAAQPSPEPKADSFAEMWEALHGLASCYFTQDKELRILISINGKREDLPFHSRNARVVIMSALQFLGIMVNDRDFRRLIRELETEAEIHAPKQKHHVRYAEHDGAIYIDMANEAGQQIRVTGDGYEVIAGSDSPVVFSPDKNRRELPIPVAGGSLGYLKELINFDSEEDYIMCVAGIVTACVPNIPQAVILIQGEHGSGKTTAAGIIQELIDPVKVSFVPLPKSDADLLKLAEERHLINVDNVSGISPNQSDTLCRASTGIGSHDDSLIRPVIINGITITVTRPDLDDRLCPAQLKAPAPEERKTSAEIKADFAERKPALFGAICNALSMYLRNREQVNPDRLPRMADAVKCCIAIEPALTNEEGGFLAAYESKRDAIHSDTVENDPVALGVIELISSKGEFEGTATDLLSAIKEIHKDGPEWIASALPRQPNVLSARLKRLVPVLRENFIDIEWNRADRRIISIREILHAEDDAPRQARMMEYAKTSLSNAPLADGTGTRRGASNIVAPSVEQGQPEKAEPTEMEQGTV
jgi:hypothetical protein